MADYKQMYITMFQSVTKAIELLQKAQADAEDLYKLRRILRRLCSANDRKPKCRRLGRPLIGGNG